MVRPLNFLHEFIFGHIFSHLYIYAGTLESDPLGLGSPFRFVFCIISFTDTLDLPWGQLLRSIPECSDPRETHGVFVPLVVAGA